MFSWKQNIRTSYELDAIFCSMSFRLLSSILMVYISCAAILKQVSIMSIQAKRAGSIQFAIEMYWLCPETSTFLHCMNSISVNASEQISLSEDRCARSFLWQTQNIDSHFLRDIILLMWNSVTVCMVLLSSTNFRLDMIQLNQLCTTWKDVSHITFNLIIKW